MDGSFRSNPVASDGPPRLDSSWLCSSYTEFDRSKPNRRLEGCSLQIATRQVADAVIARPSGRIDHQSAKHFEDALMPLVAQTCSRHGSLILDFSAVEYISSVGLRVLMVVAKKMRECDAQLRVAALSGIVAEIFAISRFDRILTVTATLDDALALGSPAALAQHG
ncbi:MAG: STAS domain-containing protein, partial [Rhizobacter sp.]|nr:STAS domain-containing protein [Rhizobacter sp.]